MSTEESPMHAIAVKHFITRCVLRSHTSSGQELSDGSLYNGRVRLNILTNFFKNLTLFFLSRS